MPLLRPRRQLPAKTGIMTIISWLDMCVFSSCLCVCMEYGLYCQLLCDLMHIWWTCLTGPHSRTDDLVLLLTHLHAVYGVGQSASLVDEVCVLHVLGETLQKAQRLVKNDGHRDLWQFLKTITAEWNITHFKRPKKKVTCWAIYSQAHLLVILV